MDALHVYDILCCSGTLRSGADFILANARLQLKTRRLIGLKNYFILLTKNTLFHILLNVLQTKDRHAGTHSVF